jgi:hypothetical protein
MKKILFTALFYVILAQTSFAQGEFEDESKIVLRNESSYALALNTNGFGINYMYGKRIDGFRKKIYTLDFSYIKHSKETKSSNPYDAYASQYVYGKTNTFFTLKGGYGFLREKFEKRDKGGVAVRYYYTIGPAIGILKPVYFEYIYAHTVTTNQGTYSVIDSVKNIRHYSGMDPSLIRGKSGFKYGLSEISVSPGIFGRFAFSFEFSKKADNISALEGGITVESYLRKIRLMAVEPSGSSFLSKIEDNGHIFVSLFFAYRFGRILKAKGIDG